MARVEVSTRAPSAFVQSDSLGQLQKMASSTLIGCFNAINIATKVLIPIPAQDETNSLVLRVSGFVAHSLQTAAGMRLAPASPETQNPARLSLILNAHWNGLKIIAMQCALIIFLKAPRPG